MNLSRDRWEDLYWTCRRESSRETTARRSRTNAIDTTDRRRPRTEPTCGAIRRVWRNLSRLLSSPEQLAQHRFAKTDRLTPIILISRAKKWLLSRLFIRSRTRLSVKRTRSGISAASPPPPPPSFVLLFLLGFFLLLLFVLLSFCFFHPGVRDQVNPLTFYLRVLLANVHRSKNVESMLGILTQISSQSL